MDNWADIPFDILLGICNRLTDLKDAIVASSVCKSWQPSFSFLLPKFQSPPYTPLLFLAEKDIRGLSTTSNINDHTRTFLNLSNRQKINLNLPATIGKRCLSVGYGWLLTVGLDFQINLFHPFTQRQISLPHLSTFANQWDPEYETRIKIRNMFVHRAIASANPWNSEAEDFNKDCIIMTTYEIGLPAFAKIGDQAWTDVKTPSAWYSDVIYYKSRFYFVCGLGVFACSISIDGQQVSDAIRVAPISQHVGGINQKYLVESCGELFLVGRGFGGEGASLSIPDYEYEYETVKNIGNQAFFLGEGASFSIPANSVNGCHQNCIYFTDDCFDFYPRTKHGAGYDIGRYNIEDATFDHHYEVGSFSYFSPPMWYL
ncbi:hypothetical protein ACFE04_009985 [Oxalis oulophora]